MTTRRWLCGLVLLGCLGLTVPAEASRNCPGTSGNYLATASNAKFDMAANGNMSIALRMKRSAISGSSEVLVNLADQNYIRIGTDNKVILEVNTTKSSATAITDTTNYHLIVATVAAGGAWAIYIDSATADASGSGGVLQAGSGKVTVCNTDGGGLLFAGRVEGVTVWNTTLTSGNVTTLLTNPDGQRPELVGSGVVGAWRMCDPNDLTDYSASPVVMGVVGTVATSTDNPPMGCFSASSVKTLLKLKN